MKVYKLWNGLSGTVEEIIALLESYPIDELMKFKYELMDGELKRMLNEYFKYRIKDYCKNQDENK